VNGGEGMDLLASIAEISVAFAGFAGIITALSGRRFGELGRGNLTRFRLMIYSSLSATFMALMPYAFLYNSSTPNWSVCILLLMIYLVGFLSLLIRVFIRQVAQGSLNGYVAFSVASLGVITTLIQLASLVGLAEPDLGIYLLGIYYLLVQSGVSFVRLITASVSAGEG